MTTVSSLFINGLLADASYVEGLRDGQNTETLKDALSISMTPALAKYIADNFSVVAHKESNDIIGSGFDATVWRGIEGGAFAGKIYVSMQGTLGAQDFLTDADLALPFGAGRQQIVDMVNWWKQITTPTTGQAAQIQLVPASNGSPQFFARLGSRLVFCSTPSNRDHMSLPLNMEFSDAVYHVASRGNQREPTFDVNQHQLSLLRQKTRRDPILFV